MWFIADTEERAALQAVGSEKQVPISGISNGLPVLCYGADESDVLYMTDTTALYRVPLQTGAAEKIADLAKLNVHGGQPFSRTANGSFVFADRTSDVPALAAICPGASGGKQKSVLTLATVNPSGQTIAQVQEFNRSNSDYQVEILDFSALLDSGSYMDLFTTWNTAIAAGDTPQTGDFFSISTRFCHRRRFCRGYGSLFPTTVQITPSPGASQSKLSLESSQNLEITSTGRCRSFLIWPTRLIFPCSLA